MKILNKKLILFCYLSFFSLQAQDMLFFRSWVYTGPYILYNFVGLMNYCVQSLFSAFFVSNQEIKDALAEIQEVQKNLQEIKTKRQTYLSAHQQEREKINQERIKLNESMQVLKRKWIDVITINKEIFDILQMQRQQYEKALTESNKLMKDKVEQTKQRKTYLQRIKERILTKNNQLMRIQEILKQHKCMIQKSTPQRVILRSLTLGLTSNRLLSRGMLA